MEKWIIKVEERGKEVVTYEQPYNSEEEYEEIKAELFNKYKGNLLWYSITYSSK